MTLSQLVYDLDASKGPQYLPNGMRTTRTTPAMMDKGGRWVEVAAQVPRLEAWGLRAEGARVNALPYSTQDAFSDWSGADRWSFLGRQGVVENGLSGWEHRSLMLELAPVRRLAAPGEGVSEYALSAIVERLDAEAAELAVLTGSTVRRRVSTAGTGESGSGWARRQGRGTGPNGGALMELGLVVPRASTDTLALYPTGRYPNTHGTVVHHLQYERGAFSSSPIVTNGEEWARTEEQHYAVLESSSGHAATVQVLVRAAPGVENDQVAWQLDNGTESERISVIRFADGTWRVELVRAGTPAALVELGTLNDGATAGLGIRVTSSELAVSLDGGEVETAAHSGAPVCNRERWGGSALIGSAWFGWLCRVRRWYAAGTDEDLVALSSWQSTLPEAAGTAPAV
jgi:hypothetical protein